MADQGKKLDAATLARLKRLLSTTLSQRHAAREAGVNRSTLIKYAKVFRQNNSRTS